MISGWTDAFGLRHAPNAATAFIILFSGVYESGQANDTVLMQQAPAFQTEGWVTVFIAFAVSSIIANYYGETNIEFIVGKGRGQALLVNGLAITGTVFFGLVAARSP